MTTPIECSHPPRRWQRRKQARAGEILVAAADLLKEKGNGALRMSDIAARAGITKGTIYLYFANKAEVLRRLDKHQTVQTIAAE